VQQGTQLGWLLDPEEQSVMVFHPNQLPEIKSEEEMLPMLDIFANWHLSVTELMSWLRL
jgi:Uma2 family endonuclease